MNARLLVGLISDTHGRLPAAVFARFDGVSHILHAGDIGPLRILSDLASIAPVTAVWGNTDSMEVRAAVPEIGTLEIGGLHIAVVHGHQVGSPNPRLLHAAYAAGDVVVFGHSHRALVERVGQRLFVNPGSAGQPRFGLGASVAVLRIEGQSAEAEIIALD